MKLRSDQLSPSDERRVERALERRYGKSMLRLKTYRWSDDNMPDLWRCEDIENGAFVIVRLNKKLYVVAEGGPKF